MPAICPGRLVDSWDAFDELLSVGMRGPCFGSEAGVKRHGFDQFSRKLNEQNLLIMVLSLTTSRNLFVAGLFRWEG